MAFVHTSIVKEDEEVPLLKDGNLHYCPLCQVKGALLSFKVKKLGIRHMTRLHYGHSLRLQGVKMMLCRLGCLAKSHYHCVNCDWRSMSRGRFDHHVKACVLKGRKVKAPDTSVMNITGSQLCEGEQTGTTVEYTRCLYCGEQFMASRLFQHMSRRHPAEAKAEIKRQSLMGGDAGEDTTAEGSPTKKPNKPEGSVERCEVCDKVILSSAKEHHMKAAHSETAAQESVLETASDAGDDNFEENVWSNDARSLAPSQQGPKVDYRAQDMDESSSYPPESMLMEEEEEEEDHVRSIKQEVDCSELDVVDREMLFSSVQADQHGPATPERRREYVPPERPITNASNTFSPERRSVNGAGTFSVGRRQVGVSAGFVNKLKRPAAAAVDPSLELRECLSWSEYIGLRLRRLPRNVRAKFCFEVEAKLLDVEFGGSSSDVSVQAGTSDVGFEGRSVASARDVVGSGDQRVASSGESVSLGSSEAANRTPTNSIRKELGANQNTVRDVTSESCSVGLRKLLSVPAVKKRIVEASNAGKGRDETTVVLRTAKDSTMASSDVSARARESDVSGSDSRKAGSLVAEASTVSSLSVNRDSTEEATPNDDEESGRKQSPMKSKRVVVMGKTKTSPAEKRNVEGKGQEGKEGKSMVMLRTRK